MGLFFFFSTLFGANMTQTTIKARSIIVTGSSQFTTLIEPESRVVSHCGHVTKSIFFLHLHLQWSGCMPNPSPMGAGGTAMNLTIIPPDVS